MYQGLHLLRTHVALAEKRFTNNYHYYQGLPAHSTALNEHGDACTSMRAGWFGGAAHFLVHLQQALIDVFAVTRLCKTPQRHHR